MRSSRILYFAYYIKKLDKTKFRVFLNYAAKITGKPKIMLVFDAFIAVFIYNISILEYFQFKFYEKEKIERKKWAGTGFLYEYQLKMNPKKARAVLENKIQFLYYFKKFVNRKFSDLQSIKSNHAYAQYLIANDTGKLVLKGSHGQVGTEVEVISCNNISVSQLIHYMEHNKRDLVEEYVVQHPSIMELSPSGLNTIRIFTQLHNKEVEFLGARFRISVNSSIDNMGAGNLAAPVDIQTGTVNGPAVYSDITKSDQTFHPVTKKNITGFSIPYWEEVIKMTKRAALHTPENRSVGWDIAITKDGPELIEGNHNWCKLLWQLPVKKGLKQSLEKYL